MNATDTVKYVKYTKCPWCLGKISTRFKNLHDRLENDPNPFAISACRQCGLGFTNPLPQGNLGYLYPQSYFFSSRAQTTKDKLITWYRNTQYHYDLSQLSQSIKLPPQKWRNYLDIGCGTGDRADYASRNGAKKVWGIDPFDKFLYPSRPGFQLVRRQPLTFKPKQKFQVVSLFGVLEHVSEVKPLLKHISENIIDSKGYLVIQVPNFNALEIPLFGGRWAGFDVPRHLWHYNLRVLTDLLTGSGFDLIHATARNSSLHPVTPTPSIAIELDAGRIAVLSTKRPAWLNYLLMLGWASVNILTLPLGIIANVVNRHALLTVYARKRA